MEHKQRLFIYDRKEMGVLILLGVMVALFAFTLGVHLGKRVSPKVVSSRTKETSTTETVPDKVPGAVDLTEQGKGAVQAADETLNQTLHDEVIRSGVKLDEPRQVKLPEHARSKSGGATTSDAEPNEPAAAVHGAAAHGTHASEAHDPPAAAAHDRPGAPAHATHESSTEAATPAAAFTLQVGSYRSRTEAEERRTELASSGTRPFVKSVDLKDKGHWFRVCLGAFASKESAEQAGIKYKKQNLINSYVVSKHD